MLPAIVLLVLAAAGTYLSITERNKVVIAAKKPKAASPKKLSNAPLRKATSSRTKTTKPTTAKRPKRKG
jgi:hypothetical protein